MDYNIISRLKTAADKYECPSFIEGDPIRFPHMYGKARDIEVSAFISAWMAYGSRKVFLEVLERLHRIMDGAGGPYRFVVSGSWRSLKNEGCLYRFYKWADFIALCRRLADVYSRFESLEELGLLCPVAEISCKYVGMVRFGETVTIDVHIIEFSGVKMRVGYTMTHADGTVCCTAESLHCFILGERIVNLKKKFPDIYEKIMSEN
jgi:acyl-CoA thioesterase FadM